MAHGWQRQGALKKAFDAYLELAKLRSDLQTSGGAAEMELERIDRNWYARADRWLQARFGELLRTAGDADRDGHGTDRSKSSFEQATSSGELSALRKFERLFGLHPKADDVRLSSRPPAGQVRRVAGGGTPAVSARTSPAMHRPAGRGHGRTRGI